MDSSSDSDAGERARNVKFVLIKSEDSNHETDTNYAYKRKLGDLIFNASFEAGNLGRVEKVNMFDYDLMVRPDVANPKYCLWFNFTVSNQLPNQCIIFTFVNLDPLVLFQEGLTPVVRTRLQPNWVRLHEDQVFYYKSSNHGNRFILSLAFRFSTYDNEHQFALFYPYSYTNLIRFIVRSKVELKRRKKEHQKGASFVRVHAHRLSPQPHRSNQLTNKNEHPRSKSSLGFRASSSGCLKQPPDDDENDEVELEIKELCSSTLSKSINLLLISSSTSKSLTIDKPRVVVLCRPAGNLDSVASLVCQGMMDFILADEQAAKNACQHIDFSFLPMLDPDSVYVGNSRTDIMGQSRHTLKLVRTNYRVYAYLNAIKVYVENICKQTNSRVVLIELKVNLQLIGSRLIGTKFKDAHRMEKHLYLPRLLSKFADDFLLENCVLVKSLPGFLETTSYTNVDHYWFELSPFAYYKRSLIERNYQEYKQIKYISLGKKLLLSLLELLRPSDKENPTLATFYPKSSDIDELVLKTH